MKISVLVLILAAFPLWGQEIAGVDYLEIVSRLRQNETTWRILRDREYRAISGDDNAVGFEIGEVGFTAAVNYRLSEQSHTGAIGNEWANVHIVFKAPRDFRGTLVVTSVTPEGEIAISGHLGSKIQIELRDFEGKRMIGPRFSLPTSGEKVTVMLRPTVDDPIPTGFAPRHFSLDKVTEMVLAFNLGHLRHDNPSGDGFSVAGKLVFDDIFVITALGSLQLAACERSRDVTTPEGLPHRSAEAQRSGELRDIPFVIGVNYPWNHYGWDFGKCPYGLPENQGWSAHEERLLRDFELFADAGVEVVRMFWFCDLRTGIRYKEGQISGLDEYVLRDVESVLKVAHRTRRKIIPVLFDFYIADDLSGKNSGRRPEVIFGNQRRAFMMNALVPLLVEIDRMNHKYEQPILAVEIMNEPENMPLLTIPGHFAVFKEWCRDLIQVARARTSLPITLGSHSIVDLTRWWSDLDLDLWQFHYYSYMAAEHEFTPLTLPREKLALRGPVLCGETGPDAVETLPTQLKDNGYRGVLFWSYRAGDGIDLDIEQIRKAAKTMAK